jgi:hypothetical protein
VPNNLIEKHLNKIVQRLTDLTDVFNRYEISCNSKGIYLGENYLGKNSDIKYKWQLMRSEKKVTFAFLFSLSFFYHQVSLTGTSPFGHLCCIDEST